MGAYSTHGYQHPYANACRFFISSSSSLLTQNVTCTSSEIHLVEDFDSLTICVII